MRLRCQHRPVTCIDECGDLNLSVVDYVGAELATSPAIVTLDSGVHHDASARDDHPLGRIFRVPDVVGDGRGPTSRQVRHLQLGNADGDLRHHTGRRVLQVVPDNESLVGPFSDHLHASGETG